MREVVETAILSKIQVATRCAAEDGVSRVLLAIELSGGAVLCCSSGSVVGFSALLNFESVVETLSDSRTFSRAQMRTIRGA